jgi:hypothetical protein
MAFQRLSSQLVLGLIGTPLLLWGVLTWYHKPLSLLYAPLQQETTAASGALLDASGSLTP